MMELPKKISKPGDLFEYRIGDDYPVEIMMYLDTIVDSNSKRFRNKSGVIHLFLTPDNKTVEETTIEVRHYYTRITGKTTKVNSHETKEK